jgi:CRISPR system Cascade subunit CasC
MNHIALHILHPFPATCLNRDDVGAPKNFIFGGVNRARVSSQCWKRQIRFEARKLSPEHFAGERTRRASDDLTAALAHLGLTADDAQSTARSVCHAFLSDTEPAKPKAKGKAKKAKAEAEAPVNTEEAPEESEAQTSTLLYFSPGEILSMAEAIVAAKKAGEDIQKSASNAAKKFTRKDAADIAIFGRMVANDASLNIEGAGLFAHAFSTHKCDNDLDFWTAVDDDPSVKGAANMSHAEFNSACYYRYIALNLDLLEDADHLKAIGKEGRQQVVRAFLHAALLAVPSAKQNSMNGHMLPEFVLGLVSTGQPFQLANAFESPVRANGQGWLAPSVEVLEKHHTKLKKVFGLQNLIREEVRLSEETPLNTFIERLVAHVH